MTIIDRDDVSLIAGLRAYPRDRLRDILIPSIQVERESFPNDRSTEVRVEIVWLFRGWSFSHSRPFNERERRRHNAEHEAAMAQIEASAKAFVTGRQAATR